MAASLPPELLHAIFQLSSIADFESIGTISAVCRRWRSVTFDLPQLWTKLVLNGSRNTSPEVLHEKAKLWLSISSPLHLQISLVYGQNFGSILPMVSYIMPASSRWTTVAFSQPADITNPGLWFSSKDMETGGGHGPFERMQLLLLTDSVQRLETSHIERLETELHISLRKRGLGCHDGDRYRTFSLILPTNTVRIEAVLPFDQIKSLYIGCDGPSGASSCRRIVDVLSSFPNLQSLHLWNDHSPLELDPHTTTLIHFPNLIHLCVPQSFVDTLSHIRAPKLESFYLGQVADLAKNVHIPAVAARLNLVYNASTEYSGPGLVFRMLFLHCSPALKRLDICNLSAFECHWVVNTIGTIEDLRLTGCTVSNEMLKLVSAREGEQCRLPRLSKLRFSFVKGLNPRSLVNMVRSRFICGRQTDVELIQSLVLETVWNDQERWDLKPEWRELRNLVGCGLSLGESRMYF